METIKDLSKPKPNYSKKEIEERLLLARTKKAVVKAVIKTVVLKRIA